jgi:quinol monooxygenase YgiN
VPTVVVVTPEFATVGKMFVVIARLAVDLDRIDEFEVLARQLWDATLRHEPGCRRYEYVRLPERGAYLALMTFDDRAAFLVHQASRHHTAIAGGQMRDLVQSMSLEFGEPVAGAFGQPAGAAPGPITVDAELSAYYADRYPAPDFGGWYS